MPTGAQILSAKLQKSCVCIWALVEPNAEPETRKFLVRGTGSDIYDKGPQGPLNFIDTVITLDQEFVFHVWEIRPQVDKEVTRWNKHM